MFSLTVKGVPALLMFLSQLDLPGHQKFAFFALRIIFSFENSVFSDWRNPRLGVKTCFGEAQQEQSSRLEALNQAKQNGWI